MKERAGIYIPVVDSIDARIASTKTT